MNIEGNLLNLFGLTEPQALQLVTDWSGDSPAQRPDYNSRMSYVRTLLIGAVARSLCSKATSSNDPLASFSGKVMQFWDSKTVPTDVAACIESWRSRAGPQNHVLFCLDSAAEYAHQHFGREEKDLLLHKQHPALAADIFRLMYLFQDGGLYIDADELCSLSDPLFYMTENTDPIFVPYALDVRYQREVLLTVSPSMYFGRDVANYFNNNIMFAPPKNSIIHKILERALHNVKTARILGRKVNIHEETGPGITTDILVCQAIQFILSGGNPENLPFKIEMRPNLICTHQELDYKFSTPHWSS